ncbi:hypothetical protein ABZ208_34325 [Streptomyces sp. NPDC006208]|uniref:hypothetical protein n=1 Tax=Streptomyces sp. NPDC006208 TaxID=3156734 RepID=UPI0033ABBD2C
MTGSLVTAATPGTPPAAWGDPGRWFVEDEAAIAAIDARGAFDETVFRDGPQTLGGLAVVRFDRIEVLSRASRRELGLDGLTGPVTLVGGGQAQWQSAVWTVPGAPRAEVVRNLVSRAVVHCRQDGSTPVALFVRPQDEAAFAAGFDGMAVARPAEPCALLELPANTTTDGFIAGLPDRKVRQNWNRDLRDRRDLGLECSVVDLTPEVARAAAEGVAHVRAGNGTPDHPRIAAWRLTESRRRPGEHRVIRLSQDGVPVSHIFVTLLGDYMSVHALSLGVHPHRRTLYHQTFLNSVDLACAMGVRTVVFGQGHLMPKVARGCVLEPRGRFIAEATA